jgi:hydroxymethylbilane synthase
LRLGFAAHIAARFSPAEMLPACGQGALGLECRADDHAVQARLGRLADAAATAAIAAERAFALRLGGNCQTPLGAYATLRSDGAGGQALYIDGLVSSVDGQTVLRERLSGPVSAAAELGRKLAEQLLSAGADALIQPGSEPGPGT